MPDYEQLYLRLSKRVDYAIEIFQQVQQECAAELQEEIVLIADKPPEE